VTVNSKVYLNLAEWWLYFSKGINLNILHSLLLYVITYSMLEVNFPVFLVQMWWNKTCRMLECY